MSGGLLGRLKNALSEAIGEISDQLSGGVSETKSQVSKAVTPSSKNTGPYSRHSIHRHYWDDEDGKDMKEFRKTLPSFGKAKDHKDQYGRKYRIKTYDNKKDFSEAQGESFGQYYVQEKLGYETILAPDDKSIAQGYDQLCYDPETGDLVVIEYKGQEGKKTADQKRDDWVDRSRIIDARFLYDDEGRSKNHKPFEREVTESLSEEEREIYKKVIEALDRGDRVRYEVVRTYVDPKTGKFWTQLEESKIAEKGQNYDGSDGEIKLYPYKHPISKDSKGLSLFGHDDNYSETEERDYLQTEERDDRPQSKPWSLFGHDDNYSETEERDYHQTEERDDRPQSKGWSLFGNSDDTNPETRYPDNSDSGISDTERDNCSSDSNHSNSSSGSESSRGWFSGWSWSGNSDDTNPETQYPDDDDTVERITNSTNNSSHNFDDSGVSDSSDNKENQPLLLDYEPPLLLTHDPSIHNPSDSDSGGNDSDSGGNDSDSGGNDSDSGGSDSDSGGSDSDSGGSDSDSGGSDSDSGSSDSSSSGDSWWW